jgi:hypothetical protein
MLEVNYILHTDFEGNIISQKLGGKENEAIVEDSKASTLTTIDSIEERKDGSVIYKSTIILEDETLANRWNHVNNLLFMLEKEKALIDLMLNEKMEEKLKL